MRSFPRTPSMVALSMAASLAAGCAGPGPGDSASAPGRVGDESGRAALFESILARTEAREAFSPVKNEALGLDPLGAMRALRDRVVAADGEAELYYALAALSAARRDRHLDVILVPGGLELPDSAGLEVSGGGAPEPRQAGVRVFPDYGSEELAYFVGEVAEGVDGPPVGSRVLVVNGMPVEAWHEAAAVYVPHSTEAGLRWKLAEAMTVSSAIFPPALRPEELTLVVAGGDGSGAGYRFPWHEPGDLVWSGLAEPRYPGTRNVLGTPTYDFLVPVVPTGHVVLVWYGFRETMVPDVDLLVEYAAANDLLDHTLVMDVTRSRGGSLGPYAMQRLQPRPFRTTFGNLRLSDVTQPFIDEKRAEAAERGAMDSGVPEVIDDGIWLLDWLETDVAPALARGDAYSNSVPFKSAHAPRDSDGILEPAPVHFRGPIAIVSGPSGGSHLDQFVSIISDNGLGPVVGMPPGGYSNTWEWEETLTLEPDGQPLVGFMWNIGHTLRPNGEILEGNPVEVDEWIPLTADNVADYYGILLDRALALAGSWN